MQMKERFYKKVLIKLPDNSNDIESNNVIKRHQRRPKKLENLCLANFVAWYNSKSANRGFNYCTLDRDRVTIIRSRLQRMQVVFIDAISMEGSGNKEPFGVLV